MLGSSKIEPLWGKFVIAAWALPTVLLFVLSALHALQVSMNDQFIRPHAPGTQSLGLGKEPGAFQLDSLAALLEAMTFNQAVADCKNRRLQRARRCYTAGIKMLGGLVILIVVLAIAI